MMEIFDSQFKTQNELDSFKKEFEERVRENSDMGKELDDRALYIMFSFLDDAFKRSCLLQISVEKNVAKDLVTSVVLPCEFGDAFDKISFFIDSKDGREIKKREQLMFEQYCDKYFKGIVGLEELFSANFD